MSSETARGWGAFALWGVPGIVLAFQISQIGALLLPAGLIAIAVLVKYTRVWPESLGVSAGVAALFLVIAVLEVKADWGCPASGEKVTRTTYSEHAESCIGNPWPWLILGLIFGVGGAVAYRVARREG
jgi:hypothetical protein